MTIESKTPLLVESVPSAENAVSALASAKAPFLFFDQVPFHGLLNGVGLLTLVAQRQIAMLPDKSVGSDLVVIAHPRGSLSAQISLKAAIDGLLAMGKVEVKAPVRTTIAKSAEALRPSGLIVETFPSRHGAISALASADAPFVHFDNAPFYGISGGTGRVTLTAQRQIATMPDGTVGSDIVVVAHLRGSFQAFVSLRIAIDSILFMAARPSGQAN